jgi:hypothetical protein
MLSSKKYKWIIPEEVPSFMKGMRRKEFDECIEEFIQSGLESARVMIPNTKPKSLARILAGRIKKEGLKDKVAVSLRGEKVFLVRKR